MADNQAGAGTLSRGESAAGGKARQKYLTFELAGEEYGIEILKVREIIGMLSISPVPRAPKYMRGVINLRGRVIPVVDLKVKFGMDRSEDTRETCIIVVDASAAGFANMLMGVQVDSVREVQDIRDDSIDPAPEMGADIDTDFILGLGKTGEKVSILLDIDKILTGRELEQLHKAGNP